MFKINTNYKLQSLHYSSSSVNVIHISERSESSSSTGPYSEDGMSAELGALNPSWQLSYLSNSASVVYSFVFNLAHVCFRARRLVVFW